MFYGEPTINKKRIKSLYYPHKQTGLCTKWSFHEIGQCNYIKILNYIISLRLLCEYFMIKIMKLLFKCYRMAIECANPIKWGYCSFGYSINVIHLWWMGVLCVTWHKIIPKSTNPKIKSQNYLNKVFILFKACPCILWDEPHPPGRNPNDVQQHFKG
jgi:hypothetical protein